MKKHRFTGLALTAFLVATVGCSPMRTKSGTSDKSAKAKAPKSKSIKDTRPEPEKPATVKPKRPEIIEKPVTRGGFR